jgi:(p)ppGpp synthase/HD superfamily hydrolase
MFDGHTFGFMTAKIAKAIQFAAKVHQDQFRKDGTTPYISHPFEVGMVLAAAGSSEHEIIVGILHDCIEHGCCEEELTQIFGMEVYSDVKHVTEDDTLPWNLRKEKYIANLEKASLSAVVVSAADLLANRSDLLRRIRNGQDVWKMFDRTPQERLRYDRQRSEIIAQRLGQHPLSLELQSVIQIEVHTEV